MMLILISYLLLPLLVVQVKAAVICPPDDAIAPCNCAESSYYPGNIYLDCYYSNLNDSQTGEILDGYLTTSGVSPLVYLNLQYNRLTRVPSQVKSCTQLVDLYFDANLITSVESGAFNFTGSSNSLRNLYLFGNQLTTIAPDAFEGYIICLLTRSSCFQSTT